uniref:Uncharacterized protein n=1 Tax=viral metagenome TaxID=1070528 RepID=A0A6C0LRT8_9ZZZZ
METQTTKIDFSKLYITRNKQIINEVTVEEDEEIIVPIILWFDPYEKLTKRYCYMLYDETNNNEFMKSRGYEFTVVNFKLNKELEWVQTDNDSIFNFIGPSGKSLLEKLNEISFSKNRKKGLCLRSLFNKRLASIFW